MEDQHGWAARVGTIAVYLPAKFVILYQGLLGQAVCSSLAVRGPCSDYEDEKVGDGFTNPPLAAYEGHNSIFCREGAILPEGGRGAPRVGGDQGGITSDAQEAMGVKNLVDTASLGARGLKGKEEMMKIFGALVDSVGAHPGVVVGLKLTLEKLIDLPGQLKVVSTKVPRSS